MRHHARSAGALLALAAARARAAPARWALPALGSALAVGLLGATAGGGTVAGEAAARATVRSLPPVERTVRVTWSGGLPPGAAERARRAVQALAPAAQTTSVLFLPTAFVPGDGPTGGARQVAQVAGIAPLAPWVRLTSGRMPQGCAPARCEVLALGGPPVRDAVRRNGLHLVTVGRGTLRSSVPLGFVPGPAARGLPAEAGPKALLVSGDPAALGEQGGLDAVFRTWGWSAPFSGGEVRSWQLGALRDRVQQTGNALRRADVSYTLTAPVDALARAQDRAERARRRVVLVGAGAAVLLAAFALLTAGALRRDLVEERRRLVRRGATTWQVEGLTVVESLGPAVLGAALGAAIALGVTALRADHAGLGAGAVTGHALVGVGPMLGALAAVALVTGLGWLGSRPTAADGAPGSGRLGGPGRLADVTAVAAAAGVAIALSRGGASADGDDPLPTLLPLLVCLAGGLVAARAAPPILRGVEAAGRRGPLGLRLAALGLARAPGGPALTVAVVAVACGLACFAAAYAATLARGDRDQAADVVPADVTAAQGPSLTSPLALAPAARWAQLAGGPVVRVHRGSATVPRGAFRVHLPLLGITAAGLPALRGLRAGDLSASPRELARRIGATDVAVRGAVVPPGARTVTVRASTPGDALALTARVIGEDGGLTLVDLGETTPRPSVLRGALPASREARRLVGLSVVPTSGNQATGGHQEAENPSTRAVVAGKLRLDAVEVDGAPVTLTGWVARGSLEQTTARAGGGLTVPFRFDGAGRALLGPRQALEERPLPVLTDPQTARSAARGGLLPVDVDGSPARARVVGTLRRFPTVPADADGVIVADEASLRSLAAGIGGPDGRPDELWLRTSRQAELLTALRAAPFTALDVRARTEVQAALEDDPLARELARTLALAALIALGLAALGISLAVTAALRDDGATLLDLERLGVDPRTLRADVRIRPALLCALGTLGGLAIGAGLLRLTVGAIGLTAAGQAAVPPLVTVVPWATWTAIVAALGLTVGLVVGLLTRRAFAGPVPRRPAGAAP